MLGEEDRGPVQSWNKARLIVAIERWRGAPNSWNDDWETQKAKSQLLEHAKSIYPTVMYKIQKTADKFQTEAVDNVYRSTTPFSGLGGRPRDFGERRSDWRKRPPEWTERPPQ